MPGGWRHLAGRAISTLGARPLTGAEAEQVTGRLTGGEASLFFAQNGADQRHGFDSAWSVDDPTLSITAMLHDVGKRHARLGFTGRVLASIAIKIGWPLTARFRTYQDHGRIGALELQRLGRQELELDFVRHHHSGRPVAVASETWDRLQAADHAFHRR